MSLHMVGLTHRSTPLRLLERVTVGRDERGLLRLALRTAGCDEAIVLSTCSRTEVYATGDIDPSTLLGVLCAHSDVEPAELHPYRESRVGLAVAEHLFRVTAGLLSRVVGEVEIQGQVRAALREAQEHGTAGAVMERLFGTALLCGRRVREETSIGAQGRSLARKAVDVGLAMAPGTEVVVVGAGRMAHVAVDHLASTGRRPVVLARDTARAARCARSAEIRPIRELLDAIAGADLVICATSAAHDVVTVDHIRTATARRGGRPLTLIDLSVPRNVDASVATLPGVRLIDIEGLDDDTSRDPHLAAAVEAGAAVVASVLRRYTDDVTSTAAGPVVAAMSDTVRETCRQELHRTASRTGLTEADIDRIAHALMGKLLHRPMLAARAAAAAGDHATLYGLGDLFGASWSPP